MELVRSVEGHALVAQTNATRDVREDQPVASTSVSQPRGEVIKKEEDVVSLEEDATRQACKLYTELFT